MATLLETYIDLKNSFDEETGSNQIWEQQELLYRISVLETCQRFVKTAPHSADSKELLGHYQLLDAYLQNLTLERRFGARINEKQCNTAHGNLLQVIQDYRKRFSSFAPGNDANCYRNTIAGVIQTVLPVWIQYRQTYTEIKNQEAV